MEEILLKIEQTLINIKKRRGELKYTQYDMADMLGISQHAYSKLESGFNKLTVERLFQIAGVLNITVEELINLVPGV